MNNDIVSVSLFSGAGGLDVASVLAGIPVSVSTDIDSDCVQTLKLNHDYFGDTEVIEGDLHQVESAVFKDIVNKTGAKKFIVIGGAPCQPFSKAGYWVGHETRRGINDPRATLVDEYLRVVTDLQPDGFVFENVESLLHPTNKVIVDKFIEIIEESGYKYTIVRANALEYGVPQKRHRLFILGTKGEFRRKEPIKTHCEPEKAWMLGLKPYATAGEAIAGFEGDEYFEEYGGEYERVTFHPDYAYANFVGTYKPVPCKDSDGKDAITYAYVPGPFMRTYVKALQNSRTDAPKPFLLVIEEINRANVAAVFGDVFQLLDRGDDEVSEYPIQASEDIKKFLALPENLGGSPDDYAEIRIPDNMFIWATMNSADQGVFPMDTAFKRRWDFTYLGIDDSEEGIVGKKVTLGQGEYRRVVEWNALRKAINNELLTYKVNEDKLMGPYFISKKNLPEGDTIDQAVYPLSTLAPLTRVASFFYSSRGFDSRVFFAYRQKA